MFLNGMISEKTFDVEGVDPDRDSAGNMISRDFQISKENCQHAKVLSSQTQRDERVELIKEIREKEVEKELIYMKVSLSCTKKTIMRTENSTTIQSN